MKTLDVGAFGSIRPRLRNDVVFLRVDTGIYLRSAENSCVLKGAGAYEWMSALAPSMNGESTVDEICDGLDDKRRATAVGLVKTLLTRGFARHAPAGGDDVLSDEVAAAFASQTNLVEHFQHADDRTPQELFARFRTSRVLVTGPPGAVAAAAVRGLLRNGLAEVTMDDPAWKGEFDAELARLDAAGTPASVATVSDAAADPGRWDVVVCAADLSDTRALLDLTRRLLDGGSADRGTRLLPVLAGGGRAVIGPFTGTPEQPCWFCAQLRVTGHHGAAQAAELWRGLSGAAPSTGDLSRTVQEMLGNALAFDVFRLRTGQLRPDDERHAVVQDVVTLESRRDRVLPHPACPLDHPHAAPEPAAPPQDDNDAYGRASVLVHPDLGVLSRWADEEIRQIPLKTGRVRLAPVARTTDPAREVSAFDVETILAARTRAVQAAVGAYVGRLGSRPPTGGAATGDTATKDTATEPARHVRLHDLEIRSGAADPSPYHREPLLPAVSLHDGTAWQVPAAAVHPFSPANDHRVCEPTAAGAAVGWTAQEVRERGVCSALAHRGLVRALRAGEGSQRARELTSEDLAADEDVAFALRSLEHIGATARVYALPGAAPVPAYVAVVEGPAGTLPDWAPGHGLDAREALRTAVRDAAGLAVCRHVEGKPADPGDRLLADFDPRTLQAAQQPAARPDGTLALDDVLRALEAEGTRALFADTTPVDLASVHGMVTGTVLLAAAQDT
jgi:bacteriocin biosynthesis cyclodehydratase domain-containing protein